MILICPSRKFSNQYQWIINYTSHEAPHCLVDVIIILINLTFNPTWEQNKIGNPFLVSNEDRTVVIDAGVYPQDGSVKSRFCLGDLIGTDVSICMSQWHFVVLWLCGLLISTLKIIQGTFWPWPAQPSGSGDLALLCQRSNFSWQQLPHFRLHSKLDRDWKLQQKIKCKFTSS